MYLSDVTRVRSGVEGGGCSLHGTWAYSCVSRCVDASSTSMWFTSGSSGLGRMKRRQANFLEGQYGGLGIILTCTYTNDEKLQEGVLDERSVRSQTW